jgi:Spy/CpxP family protein refolding chaperone
MALLSPDSPIKRIADAIDKLTLTDDQKTKIADIKKEYEPKFKDIRDKMTAVLTDDQKKAVEDAKKKISDATDQAGRRQAMQDARAAVTLTSDQQTKMREAGTEMRPLMTEVTAKLRDILTDDQKKDLDKAMPQRGGGRGGRGGRGGGAGGAGGGTTQSREST